MMDDLVTWLRAQLDDDERVARDAGGRNWGREAYGCVVDAADTGLIVYSEGTPSREQADHIVLHDPARVLRDVEAKRRILELTRFDAQFPDSEGGYDSACEDVIKLLAEPLADRPGYREEWRP